MLRGILITTDSMNIQTQNYHIYEDHTNNCPVWESNPLYVAQCKAAKLLKLRSISCSSLTHQNSQEPRGPGLVENQLCLVIVKGLIAQKQYVVQHRHRTHITNPIQ